MTEPAKRAGVFDNPPDFDIKEFSPKTSRPTEKDVPMEAIKAVSEAQFPSREPVSPSTRKAPKKREPRVYRTGRNIQFNAKISLATNDAIYDITEKQGWVLGEMLEHAVDALKEKLASEKKKAVGEGAA